MTKRFTFLLLFVCAYLSSYAQTPIFFEDFESANALPAGWTTYDEDGRNPYYSFMTDAWIVGDPIESNNNMAWSTSYYSPPGQSDDWLVTPLISLPDVENLVLLFDAFPLDENYPDNYEVWVSTTGNEPADFDTKIFEDTDPIGGVIHNEGASLAEFAGQDIYIAFRNVANDELLLGIDNVEVTVAEVSKDLEMVSIDMNPFMAPGDTDVIATVKNLGGSEVTSFDLTWSIGDEEYTQTISDVNIAFNLSYQVTHPDAWDAEPGDYVVTVEVSNINGEGDDENTENDSLSKSVSIATNSVQRKPLYEEFTSSTCGPCYTFNTQLYNPFFATKDYDDLSLVKYQVNFPGSGDPYYTFEVGQRRTYYGVMAAPTLLLEGKETSYLSMAQMNTGYNNAYNDPAFFEIDLDATKSGTEISVDVDVMPYVSGTFKVYIAVVEKVTTENKRTNGEIEFHHVLMKMLPNAQGTQVDFTSGESYSLSIEDYDLANTNVEDFNDLHVVVWVQDDASKIIMQSENSADSEALDLESFDVNTISMYPNPADQVLNILTEDRVDVSITDLLGQNVVSQIGVKNGEQIDISHLSSGVYFVNFTQDATKTTKKLIVK